MLVVSENFQNYNNGAVEKALLMNKTKIRRIVFIALGHSSQKITGIVFSAAKFSFCVAILLQTIIKMFNKKVKQ
jgi:hypothetical protein